MTTKKRDATTLKLLGGRLCLDFVNTMDWRGTDNPQEFLNTYQDFVNWCLYVGICSHQEARQLVQTAGQSSVDSKRVLNRAIKLREAIYRIFAAGITKKSPLKQDLSVFNSNLSRSMQESQIVRTKGGYIWDNAGDKKKLNWILHPIVRSAADLLVSSDLKRIKACADPACGWLFIDVSRNQSRRWCDMQDCGNRAKATRFYKKKRKIFEK